MSIDLDDLARDAVASSPTATPDVGALRRRVKERQRHRRILTGAAVVPFVVLAAIGVWAMNDSEDAPAQVVAAGSEDPATTRAVGQSEEAVPLPTPEDPTGTSTLAVPYLIGNSAAEATDELGSLGLISDVVVRPGADLSRGVVVATDPEEGTQVATGATVIVTMESRPSQSQTKAARDQIVPALAALPFEARVRRIDEWFGPTQVDTDVGTWIISRPPDDRELPNGCLLGDGDGVYGRDYICLFEYAEILLIAHGTGQIIRAYPFPGLSPRSIYATEDALYCIRQGDGGLPHSMLCRIDLDTFEATVRVFPDALNYQVGQSAYEWTPSSWTIDAPTNLVLWENLDITESGVTIGGHGGTATVDPNTLALLTIDDSRPGAVEERSYYTIEEGDLLGEIATRFSVTVDAILSANPSLNPNLIIEGQILVIPGARTDG